MSTLMIANPRRKRRRRAMTAAQAKYFAPRRKARRRRRSSGGGSRTIVRYTAAPRARRRRSGGGGGGVRGILGSGRGIVGAAKTVAIQGTAAAAGLIGTQMVLDRIPYVKDLTGNKRIAAKVGLAALVAVFGRRVIPAGLAPAIATGIAAGAAMDLYNNWQSARPAPSPALSGGIASPGGVAYAGLHRRVIVNN